MLQNVGGEGPAFLTWGSVRSYPLPRSTHTAIHFPLCLPVPHKPNPLEQGGGPQTDIDYWIDEDSCSAPRLDPAHWPRMAVWFAGCLATPME